MKDNLDYEKHGVRLGSRYGKPHEYIIMAQAIQEIPIQYWSFIKSVDCDSQANFLYSVVFNDSATENIRYALAQLFAACIMNVSAGHNGISFGLEGDNEFTDIPANWNGYPIFNECKAILKHTQEYWYYINILDISILALGEPK